MIRTITTKLIPAAAAVVVAVGAAATLGAGPATAATPDAMLTSKGSTSMDLHVVNNTGQTMTLISATNAYGHWQKRPTDITAQSSTDASNYSYSGNGSEIDLTYRMGDGTLVTVQGLVPLAGTNSVTPTVSNNHFTIAAPYASGYHPTFTVTVNNA